MRLRRRYVLLATLLGVATAVLPAIASSETSPTVDAVNEPVGLYSEEHHHWSPTQVTVMAGGMVTFQNTGATVPHGVVWDGGPGTPSCAGVPLNEAKTSWKGTCTFAQAGTYTYHCYVHPTEMTGKVEVSGNGTTTTTTTTTTGTTTGTTTTTTTPPSSQESPLAGPVSQALKLAKSQRGGSVRGTLDISQAAAGGRLEVDLLAQSASLVKARHSRRVRVGRLVRSSVSTGRLSFSVRLNARARRALKRHHRLALTVKIIVTPAHGEPVTLTRAIVEHA